MPTFFVLISEYFWLLALVFGVINYRKALSTSAMAATSNQTNEAESYLKRFAIGANVPWVVMGIGQVSGYTPTVWYYFRPQDGNPFVIAWLAVILLTTSLYSYWVLFAGGAQKVLDYNLMSAVGQHKAKLQSLRSIKLFAAFGPLFLPFWVYLAASMDVPLPK
jgi:hypothetical protein